MKLIGVTLFLLTLTLPLFFTKAFPETQDLKAFREKTPYRLLSLGISTNCLTVKNGDTSSNAIIVISECQNEQFQYWQEIVRSTRPNGPIHLRVKHSEKCLTSELDQSGGIFQSTCDERNLQQLWTARTGIYGNQFHSFYNEFAMKCLNGYEARPDVKLSACGGPLYAEYWSFTGNGPSSK